METKTEKTIAEKIKDKKGDNIYTEAAKKFKVELSYVYKIANSKRKAVRGKGKQIKEWLESKV